MRFLDLTLPTPAENLALDEALLEEAEEAAESGCTSQEVLRLWEPAETMVVLGRSSRRDEEVNVTECQRRDIPIFRRSSGGAAIVTGPGCLMYAVVLGYAKRPALRAIDQAHCFVLSRLAEALRPLCPQIEVAGTSDLALAGKKVSGNSMRCRREHLLYHGTLLYDFPLPQIADLLRSPPRQPDYRAGRGHVEFVANLPTPSNEMRTVIQDIWTADVPSPSWPRDRVRRLVEEKYRSPSWNERL